MKDRYLAKIGAGLATAAVALVLCSCGGSSTPQPICGAPQGTVVVAYPAPNSTAIPDNFAGVIFASSTQPLGSAYQALLLPNGSSSAISLLTVAMFSGPLPSPNQVPSFPNPIYQSSASGGFILPAATLVNVYLNDLNSNCAPRLLSSFTSQ